MLERVKIEGYRGLESLTLEGLGRVNLLVGTNGSGKTSVLESLFLLASPGSTVAIEDSLRRRGEVELVDEHVRFDLNALFPGGAAEGAIIRIGGHCGDWESSFTAHVRPSAQLPIPIEQLGVDDRTPLFTQVIWEAIKGGQVARTRQFAIPTTREGTTSKNRLEDVSGHLGEFSPSSPVLLHHDRAARFVSSTALTAREVLALFEEVLLTEREETVLAALRLVEPRLERLAALPASMQHANNKAWLRGGFVVKLQGLDRRLHAGSMGDGFWRMLGLSLALVQSAGGTLLVDDVDTGLHHTVMAPMWRMVKETAERLNVQVVATTHSRDCVEALASIAHDGAIDAHDVTIHRVERGQKRSIAYTEAEIVAAAAQGIEVR